MGGVCFSCVKPKTKNPVPALEYVDFKTDFAPNGKSIYTGQDTALLVFGYEDGDGNLFRDSRADLPNVVITPFYFYPDSNKFVKGGIFSYTLLQPDNGYYKGKSIKGQISVPLSQYRPDDLIKKLKFEIYMVDMSNNKSNVVNTPTISLNF